MQELEAQHEDLVERNRILRHRPDLPVERTEFHDRFVKLQSQLTQRTAELEAAKAIQAIDLKNNNAYREQVASLQAELERVRGELQGAEAGYFVAERELQGANNKYDELRTLIAALPKVEVITSDTVVNIVQQYNFHRWMLRALQHRQGMEG